MLAQGARPRSCWAARISIRAAAHPQIAGPQVNVIDPPRHRSPHPGLLAITGGKTNLRTRAGLLAHRMDEIQIRPPAFTGRPGGTAQLSGSRK